MIRRSGTASSTGWPAASWPISTATGRRSSRPPRRGEAALRAATGLLLGLILLAGASCAYFNTFYNARRAFEEGERLARADSALPVEARAAYEKAVEKSAIVLRRHGDSRYADDALLLMGLSFQRLGRNADATATLQRLVDRFPDSDLVPPAWLGLARARRASGDAAAARAALDRLAENPGSVDEREILHERALVALEAGDEAAAAEAFRTLSERFPDYVRGEDVALRVADAHLAVGDAAAALEAYATYRRTAPSPAARRTAGLRLASALTEQGRHAEARELLDGLLADSPGDSVSAHVRMEIGFLDEATGETGAALEDFREVRELLPGSGLAARATLHAGRILWFGEKRRDEALDTFLDAFLHAPGTAYADSARTLARQLSEIVHFRNLVEGGDVEDDRQATAEYRLGEQILSREGDRAEAIAVFETLVEDHPDSPWAPRAMLAIGVLEERRGDAAASRRWLDRLVQAHPESPAADSARRELGLEVPEREAGFYDPTPLLVGLLESLPRARDPMIAIADQLDRYAERRAARASAAAGSGLPAAAAATREEEDRPTPQLPTEREGPAGEVQTPTGRIEP